ncbi:MAG: hypothetical protein L3J03_07335 [Desulfobacterales bacterium]|nr:hypothetical protein [Desulfobacterales bacterium]
MDVKVEKGLSPLNLVFYAIAMAIAAWCVGSIILGIVQADEKGLDIFRKYIEFFGLTHYHYTELSHYIYVKGIEYILAVLYFFAFPVFYLIINKRDND